MTARLFPYTHLRREQNCTRFTAFILALIQVCGWIFLRLESPAWQALREQHRQLYPHLADKRITLGDPLRYLTQTAWLLLVRPAAQTLPQRQRTRRRLKGYLMAVFSIVQRPWNLLSGGPKQRHRHANQHLAGSYREYFRPFWLSGLWRALE